LKACTRCKVFKPLTDFDRSRLHYLTGRCKVCRLEVRRLNRGKEETRKQLKALSIKRHKQAMRVFKNEDFAQWLAVKVLEGKSLKQKIDFAWIDYLRQTFGILDCQIKTTELEFETAEFADSADVTFEKFLVENLWVNDLDLQRRVMVCLTMMGFHLREIGLVVGVSESRVSIVLRGMSKFVRKSGAINNCLETNRF